MTSPAEFLNKHILSHINVHTHRHNFVCLLRIDGHVCTNEWINKCDACSLVLIHIDRIINFSTVWFSVQKKPSAQTKERLWDRLRSRVTNRLKPCGLIRLTLVCWGRQHWTWRGHTVQSLQLLTHDKRSLTSFSPFAKLIQLWPCCSSSGRDRSLNPYFATSSKTAWFPEELKNKE